MNRRVPTPPPSTRRVPSLASACASVAVAVTLTLTIALLPTRAPAAEPAAKPLVLTSFLPIHSLTLAIAGDLANVQNWLPQGVDPHDFQFSPRDLRRLRSASILVVGGLGLEGWSESKLKQLSSNPSLRIVDAASGIPKEALIHEPCEHDHDHTDTSHAHEEAPNPHFWLDPMLMTHAVTNITRALQAADPAQADAYAQKAATTLATLQALHQDYAQALNTASAPFITYHNAFPYLARRYSLRLVGVVESGPTDQPSARQLADLGRLVRSEGVGVLFMDGEPPRLARQLASDLKLKLASLETLETGELGLHAYEQGMRRNLEVLKTHLRRDATP